MQTGNPLPFLGVMIVILFFLGIGLVGAIFEAIFTHLL
jgi:hypothetical protein